MRGFKYILILLALCISVGVWGQYNPSNPSEPGAPVKQYTLTLVADPSGGGSFSLNATSSQTEGTTFWVQANTASNFKFVNWTDENGDEISNVYRFQYTMPSRDAKLTAHFTYTPAAPGEPSEAIVPPKPVYAPLFLTAQPAAGCTFNIASGNNYEVGSTVSVKANVASNFKFVNWTKDGVEVSTANPFSYTMLAGDEANQLVANLVYEPGSPVEPTERLYHKVFLISNPAGGGTFNVASGNEYEQGTNQTFRAYNNTWYTFTKWTVNDEEVSTNSVYTFPIPENDITLVAHFTYNYNPGSPAEPSQPTDKELSLYGMTQNGVKGQTINYPVYLENSEEVPSMTVVVKFPEGFTVQTGSTALSERAAGKTLTVVPVPAEGNAYRFDITGGTAITGNNGKVFDVPVTISETAEEGKSYEIILSNGARINGDETKTVINSTRQGYIYVEEQREDGLYASFTFDKLQNRFQFTNQSSAKALEWTWNFGDGTSSTERNPLHTYATEGSYDVTLTVKGESGTDVAMMTVLVNNKNTWRVNGTLFLDTEAKGVRYFTSTSSLLDFMAASPINSNVSVVVKPGTTFGCDLSADDVSHLSTIQSRLAEGEYTLTLTSTGSTPTMGFGKDGEVISTDVVNIFTALGNNLVRDNVNLKLWGIIFDPTKIEGVKSQTIMSGEQTAEVDFSPISTGLTYTWTAQANEYISGNVSDGTGNIPVMTIMSTSTEDVQLIYDVVAKKGNETFCTFTHTITVRPALDGDFTNLTPAKGASLDATTVTLQWNGINNAVYDVYLWNAVNQKPTTPMATGITETSFTSTNFCQNHKSYKWQIVARNATQQINSEEMSFSVLLLPNLHVSAITLPSDLEAGKKATIKWTVRNDGVGDTDEQKWNDRLWLVPDVYGGTNQKSCILLKTVKNVKSLASGEEYEGSAEVELDETQYGNYYFLVAADMSSVTNIEWDAAGGSIVNPYEPATAEYGYLMATTVASGNKVPERDETTTRSDNFFYVKAKIDMPQMTEEDWNLLKNAYQDMGNGEGWTKTWNFDVERRTVQSLPGVSILGGHVVSINLSNNGLTGSFPFRLLSLPNLETLNLSENQLTGDIGTGMTAFLEDKPDFSSKLTAVNIANNQFSGNVTTFAQPLTSLTTLYASDNCLADVKPAISADVTTLTLQNQTIDKVVTIDVNNLDAASVWAQIPTVLLYDHATQGYAEKIRMLCPDPDSEWSLTVECTKTSCSVPTEFDGPADKVLAAQIVDDTDVPTGSSLKVKFLYILPNLHVSAVTLPTELEAGTKPVIRWTVRNDGAGSTVGETWTDRVWLVANGTDGTSQTDCKLLAEVSNVKGLASGEEYEGSAEVNLDETQYGDFYIIVAADMSSVTDIDWEAAGTYRMATTGAEGNLVIEEGETATRSDNFLYTKVTINMPQMTEDDWNILKNAYQDMGNGEGWTNTWNFDVDKRTVESLPGVSILGGHVVSIDLSNNGLTGSFPFRLLSLPNLETLNLSENQLTGDIGTGMTAFLEDKPDFSSKLTAVNIANNRFSGNVTTFAQPLTSLTTLYASDNCLADVKPAISADVTTLTLQNQTIDKVVTIDVNNLDAASVWAQIPTVLLYDHATQGYAEKIRLLCKDTESEWSMTLNCTPTSIPVSEEDFDGPNAKIMTATVIDDGDQPTGSALKAQFLFVLPNLHVSDVTLPADLEAGTKPVIKWKVRNDGAGSTEGKTWKDRVWIVSDVTGGTGQSDCKLLAEVNNVKSLASGEEYEGSAEIDLLDEKQYGEYYFLVSSDMSTVTGIDWATAGGSVVNPYKPATADYGYLMATTEASGNLVREDGETSTRSDNFFYIKATINMPQMTEGEWNMLKNAYQDMGNGDGWTNTWNFDVDKRTVESLPGVSILGGHVVSIDLSNNGLTGAFPFRLLSLPELETLNLSENQLTGDIGTGMTAFLEDKPDFSSKLTAVNIANNQFSGNVTTFAQPLTSLTTLYASDNCLADVKPAISADVTTLTLQNQTIDKVVTIDVNNLDAAAIWAQIPTVLLYDHATQGYAEKIRMLCPDPDSEWSLTVECTKTSCSVPTEFDGPADKVLAAQVVDDTDVPTGSSLKVKFLYVKPTSTGYISSGGFATPVDVYSTQGLKVRSGVTSLDELPQGTYIISGRKVRVAR